MNEFKHPFLDTVFQVDNLTNTMEKAEELIKDNKVAGNFLIVSDKQNRGVGRKSNNWYSPKGGLWFSLGIYGFSFASNFTLFCGIQILKAIESETKATPLNSTIKWPNDIYINGKKVAGIIVKHFPRSNYYIIGIGINTNLDKFPAELQNTATSIKLETEANISHQVLLTCILDNLSDNLPEYLSEYRIDEACFTSHDYLKDRTITIKTEFAEYKGKYHGISPSGAIQLKLSNRAIQLFYAGEISIIS
jgi:BirA family transcriptional regulator, biotin operon repressor / biotin---[acetyl-CoA-carboxylase] ligase